MERENGEAVPVSRVEARECVVRVISEFLIGSQRVAAQERADLIPAGRIDNEVVGVHGSLPSHVLSKGSRQVPLRSEREVPAVVVGVVEVLVLVSPDGNPVGVPDEIAETEFPPILGRDTCSAYDGGYRL